MEAFDPAITLHPKVTLDEIYAVAEGGKVSLEGAREGMVAPDPRKNPPRFSASEVAELCGLNREQMKRLLRKPDLDLPRGTVHAAPIDRDAGDDEDGDDAEEHAGEEVGDAEADKKKPARGRKRWFSLQETRQWVKQLGRHTRRPAGAVARTLASTGFKGGSTKTTTAVQVCQALSLWFGRDCLLVDLDSQATSTTMMDLLPEKEVLRDRTLLPYFEGKQPNLDYAIQKTYWDGIDILPATFDIYEMEIKLPIRAVQNQRYDFWAVLDKGLDSVRHKYDVIVIDCPPSLSYLTFNAVYAADGLIVPTPPDGLEYASTVMFWRLFIDLYSLIEERLALRGETLDKEYDFVSVLLSKVVKGTRTYKTVKGWLEETYGSWVSPIEIPLSEQAKNKAAEFSSVYDVTRGDQDMRSVRRIRNEINKYASWLDERIVEAWQAEAAK